MLHVKKYVNGLQKIPPLSSEDIILVLQQTLLQKNLNSIFDKASYLLYFFGYKTEFSPP